MKRIEFSSCLIKNDGGSVTYKAVLFDYDGTLIEFSPSNLVLIFREKWGEEIRKGFSTLLFSLNNSRSILFS